MTPAELNVLWDYTLETDPAYEQERIKKSLRETLFSRDDLL
jgi:hypothetical protein